MNASSLLSLAVVAAGGALGTMARFGLTLLYVQRFGAQPAFPWATLGINVSGSFAIGFVAALAAAGGVSPLLRLFVTVGILGGYTTFSTFSLELLGQLDAGRAGTALLYAAGSVVAGLAAAYAGSALARSLT